MRLRTAAFAGIAIALIVAACSGGGLESDVSEELSAAGGSVILNEGASIYVPPGAISEAASVTISRGSDENPPPKGLEAAESLGEPFRIEIEGQDDLASPVTVEIPYDPESLPDGATETTIFLAYFDEEANEWIPVSGVVDTERNVIAVQTSHLSWWQVWTWNWGAWIAVLNNLLTLNLTDWFDAVALLTEECSQGGETVTVDASKANNVVQGCVGLDDPQRPELRVVNPKSFFYEVRSISHEGNMFPQRILGPGDSVSFEAPIESSPPMVYIAEINQRAGWYLVAHLIIQMLPGLNQLGIQGSQIACITERIDDVSDIAAAVESLVVERNGAAAAEDLANFLLDDAAVLRFITASDDCLYGAAATWSPEGIRQIGAATATIMSATDFVANYLLNYRSEVSFTWAQPTPTPAPTVPVLSVEPNSTSLEQQASNRAMQFCREDFLRDGFQEIGDGVLEGLVVSIFGGDSTTFQIRNMVVDFFASEPLSPADRANGVEWNGAVSILWINRYRLQSGAGDWTEWKNAFAVYDMHLTRGSWGGSEVSGGAGFLIAEYEGCTRNLDYYPDYGLN